MSAIAVIALGGNQGDVPSTMAHALTRLGETPDIRILRQSPYYRTTPIGVNAGGVYINAAAVVATTLPPESLLENLQQVEQECGRVRTVHWGPRTLDLDLIRHGDVVLDSPRLVLPHPACWYRRFVLDPWCDVDPDWIHPVLGESVREMRDRLLTRPLEIAIVGGRESAVNRVRERLHQHFSKGDVTFKRSEDSPIITLLLEPVLVDSPRTVSLPAVADPSALAEQVLRGALDEPVMIESFTSP